MEQKEQTMEETAEQPKKEGFWKKFAKLFKSLMKGELLVRFKVDKYLPHILVVALAIIVMMFVNCWVESCLIERKYTRNELKEAEDIYRNKNLELISLGRMSRVETLLRENGVGVGKPEKPAIIIEK